MTKPVLHSHLGDSRGRILWPRCKITHHLARPRVLYWQPPAHLCTSYVNNYTAACSFLQRNPKHSLSLVWCSLFPAGAISQQVLALRGGLQTYYFISVSANRVQKGQHPQAALRASERTRQQISSPRKRHCQNSLPGACQQASATSDPCRSHLPLLQDALCLAKGPHVLPTRLSALP